SPGHSLVNHALTSTDSHARATRRRRLAIAAAVVLVVTASTVLVALRVDARGVQFFQTGKEIVDTLDRFASALAQSDAGVMAQLHASDFAGTRLGLLTRELADARDGVEHFRMKSDGAASGRAAALAEWKAYRESFASVDEAGLHLERLERWSSTPL